MAAPGHRPRLLAACLMASAALAAFTAPAVAVPVPAGRAAAQEFRPWLVGVLVADLPASRRWYEDVLGFRADGEGLPAVGDVSGVILERGGFRLELIARTGSIAAASRVTKDDEALLRGIKKIAFAVDDLEGVMARAAARGATVVRALHDSRYAGMQSLILADPDGNWIQIYGPRAAARRP